ncbi:hypothetical protein MSIMFI_04918 [Mycobacterium simulans]|nr:hypothetical protein MSIMFI_04918 [Mycobacterium simulans]
MPTFEVFKISMANFHITAMLHCTHANYRAPHGSNHLCERPLPCPVVELAR